MKMVRLTKGKNENFSQLENWFTTAGLIFSEAIDLLRDTAR